jgi:hypothetical protein
VLPARAGFDSDSEGLPPSAGRPSPQCAPHSLGSTWAGLKGTSRARRARAGGHRSAGRRAAAPAQVRLAVPVVRREPCRRLRRRRRRRRRRWQSRESVRVSLSRRVCTIMLRNEALRRRRQRLRGKGRTGKAVEALRKHLTKEDDVRLHLTAGIQDSSSKVRAA